MARPASAEADALRLIARRPRTRAELTRALLDAGHAPAEVEEVLDRAVAGRLVDDAALAYDYVVTRAPRQGKGRERLVRELEARGVERETALAAWRRAVECGDLDEGLALLRAVRKRVAAGGAPTDERRYARVYTALLRDGFDRDAIEAALDRSVGRPAERNEP